MKAIIHDTQDNEHPIDIEESERQMIILSLALCSLLRPGFLSFTRDIAVKFHGGNPEMFEHFRQFNENVKPVEPVHCPQHPPT